jgi:hypothetical protein
MKFPWRASYFKKIKRSTTGLYLHTTELRQRQRLGRPLEGRRQGLSIASEPRECFQGLTSTSPFFGAPLEGRPWRHTFNPHDSLSLFHHPLVHLAFLIFPPRWKHPRSMILVEEGRERETESSWRFRATFSFMFHVGARAREASRYANNQS